MDQYKVQWAIPSQTNRTKKEANKQTKNHTTTTKTNHTETEQWDLHAWWHLVCHWEWPPIRSKTEKTKKHKTGPGKRAKSNTAQSGNQGSPQPGSPGSQRVAVRHNIRPVKNINPSTPLMYPNQRFRYPTTPDANTYCGCGPAVTYFSAMSK